MEEVNKVIAMLWDITKNKNKFEVNVHSKENEIIVGILKGKRWHRFKNKNADKLREEVEQSLLLA